MAQIACPACLQQLEVKAIPAAGTQVRCYLCQSVFAVGASQALQPVAFLATLPQSPLPPQQAAYPQSFEPAPQSFPLGAAPRPTPSGVPLPVGLAIAGGTVAGLFVIALIVYSLLNRSPPPVAQSAPTSQSPPIANAVPPAAPASTAIPTSAAPPISLAAEVSKAPLSHKFKPGMRYGYAYTIGLQVQETKMNYRGVIGYACISGDPAVIADKLRVAGVSAPGFDAKTARLVRFGGTQMEDGYFEGYTARPPISRRHIVVGANGDVVWAEKDEPLPFMFGGLSNLMFERLPLGEETTWQVENSYQMALPGPPFGRNANAPGAVGLYCGRFFIPHAKMSLGNIPVLEKITYRLGLRKDDLQVIHKTHEILAGPPEAPLVSVIGDGSVEFDVTAGCTKKCRMKLTYRSNRPETTRELPCHFEYDQFQVVPMEPDID